MNIYQTFMLSIIASCLVVTSQTSIAADYSRAEKELRIMSKIFETSMSEANDKNSRSYFTRSSRTTQSTYLAKQGMVFTFSFPGSHSVSSNDWRSLGEGIGHLVGSIGAEIAHSLSDNDEPPVLALVPKTPRLPFPNRGWDDDVEAYEDFQQAMEELRDEQRDKREEVRDIQRSIRDIERKARREEVDSKKLDKIKSKLEVKMKALNQKMEEYEKSMKDYRDQKVAQIKAKNTKKSDLIISTLCDYGATLRSLNNGEYVTLIFSNFENRKDKIYVFNYKDVKSCSNKDKLIKKAVSYQI